MICILGKSGVGKDSLAKKFCEKHPEYKKVVSYTTRPKREYEVDGEDYKFISRPVFESMKSAGMFIAVSEFNNWQYAMAKTDCLTNSVAVVTPAGMRDILRENIPAICVLMEVDDRSRLMMLLDRGDDVNEIVRRFPTEATLFDGVEREVNYILTNNGYGGSVPELVGYLEEILKIDSGELKVEDSRAVKGDQE